jgi:hypothetical protein
MTVGKPKLLPPVESKIVKRTTREIPNGTEFEHQYTMTGADGTVVEINSFSQRIELPGSYSQTLLTSFLNRGEVYLRLNQVIVGKKGPVEGDTRYDDIDVTSTRPDGTVTRQSMSKVPVALNHPVAGMPLDRTLALFTEYFQQAGTAGNKQTLDQFLRDPAH